MKTKKPSPLIDHLEVCRLTGIKPPTWRKWVQFGKVPLPHSTISTRMFYRVVDIDHYLERGFWPNHMVFKGVYLLGRGPHHEA